MSAGRSTHGLSHHRFHARSLPLPRWTILSRRLTVAGAALACALGGSIPIAAQAAAAQSAPGSTAAGSRLVPVTSAPELPRGSHVAGDVAGTAQVTGAVALRLPDPAAVTAFIGAVSSPRSSQFHHFLAPGEFTSRFGPSSLTVAAVERQLRSDGLIVSGVSANHLLVSFAGTAARVESAFHTGLRRVALAGGGMGQATTSAITLPASIASDVQAVVGLDQLVRERSSLVSAPSHHAAAATAIVQPAASGGPVACSAAVSEEQFGGLTDQQVAAAYGLDPLYGAGDLAAGQTVDIYELEPFATADIAAFDKCYFGTSHTGQISVTSVDGGPGTGPGGGEAELDIEDVSALAPGAKIHVFQAPNMSDPFGPLDNWNAIAVADDANQISTSWGLCETVEQQSTPGVIQVENEIFEQTAAQGQTVFSAAGDDGSDDCAGHNASPVPANLSVDDPGSQPYVTSVGGTTITNPAEPPKESVWNNGSFGGAGGGGISEAWAMPSWQASLAVPQTTANQACSNDPSGTADNFHVQGLGTTLPGGTLCREVPDVSALADPQTGPTIFYGGFWTQIGGTSSSTPMWAAMLAEINASSSCAALPHGTGFADPLLYQVASTSNYGNAFNDVTLGNNDNLAVGSAVDWPAGKGFDLASGLGTPRVTNVNGAPGLASQLCAAAAGGATPLPQVTSLMQVTGNHSIAGGGTVKISGSNFGGTQGSVFFGNVSATVVNWSATSITVDVPAFYAPPGTPSGVGGRAIVTVVTVSSPRQSSAPGPNSVYFYTANSSGGPVVDYVSSSTGPMAGGNTVHIIGAGLTGATAVTFGGVAATTFNVVNDNEISATVPAENNNTTTCAVSLSQGICATAVIVVTPSGQSSGPPILPAYQGPIVFSPSGTVVPPAGCNCELVPAPQEYDYAPAPHISSVSPAFASEFGTSADVITGSGFNLLTFEYANVGPAGVGFSQDFGIEGITPTQIVLAIPPTQTITTEPTSAPLSIQSGLQLSNISKVAYAGIPIVTGISKHLADQANPGSLTITGKGLSDVNSVVLQGQGTFISATSVVISKQTDTSLTVALPQFLSFPADVLACSATTCSAPDPQVDTLLEVYAGRPVVTSSGPASGPAHGGTIVTIQGALDSWLTAVDFGSTPATILQEPFATASGTIFVVAPPGKAGTKVNITISTLGGLLVGQPTSAVNKAAVFTYKPSSPTAPLHVVAMAGVKSATASWKPPADNGGSAVTGYQITVTAKGHKPVVVKVSATTTKVTVKLAAGVAWTFTVQATNKFGLGLAAKSKAVTPKS